MPCLSYKNYDPAVAVTKSTATAIAMTALDTTNLRNTFLAPASGIVLVRMQFTVHGATTTPQLLMGVMEGTSVLARCVPRLNGMNLTAATLVACEVSFLIGGLTPSQQYSYDAAYGVETAVASSAIKYGGPNNATGNNAFGGFGFEIWSA